MLAAADPLQQVRMMFRELVAAIEQDRALLVAGGVPPVTYLNKTYDWPYLQISQEHALRIVQYMTMAEISQIITQVATIRRLCQWIEPQRYRLHWTMDRGSPAVVVLNPNIRKFPFAIISLRVLQSLDFKDVKPIKRETPTSSASGWRPRAAAVVAAVAATSTKGVNSASTALKVAETQTTISTDLLNVGEQWKCSNVWITLVVVCLTAIYMWYTYGSKEVRVYMQNRVCSSVRHVRRGALWCIGGRAALRGYDEAEATPNWWARRGITSRQPPPVGGDRAADREANVQENVIWFQNVGNRAALSPNNESIIPLVTNGGHLIVHNGQYNRLLSILWQIPSPGNQNKLHADRLCSVLQRPGSRPAEVIEIDVTTVDHRRYCQLCVGTLMAQIATLYPPPPSPPPGPPSNVETQYMARDRSAPGNPPTFWEELAEAMSSESNNEVLLERLRAIPAVARNILQTEDDDDESDSEETSDGIDSNPSVDDGMPNDRIQLDP
jgi:hypothetical protein